METSHPKSRRYWTSIMVAERYSVTTRTLHAWVKDGRIARPTKLPNGRNAWTDETIEALDAAITQED
jgi:predicted site-specific integrase-resolvase